MGSAPQLTPLPTVNTARRRRHTTLRATVAAGPALYEALAFDVEPVGLAEAPDLLIVALDSQGNGGDADLSALLATAGRGGVPRVVMDHAVGGAAPAWAGEAEAVFAVHPARRAAYAAAGVEARPLDPWVQPAVYHPYLGLDEVKALKPVPVAAFDDVADDWLAGARMGRLPRLKLEAPDPAVLRRSGCVVVGDMVADPRRQDAVLQAAAAGTPVIHAGALDDAHPLRSLVVVAPTPEAVAAEVARLGGNAPLRDQTANAARRAVLRDHVLPARLTAMAAAVGVDSGWRPHPLVTVTLPTRRPHLLPQCLESFRRQDWPNKEMVVVLHTRSVDRAEVDRFRLDNPDVRFVCVSEEQNVGTCLNIAIDLARGEHCVKMDDDDWYGEHYVSDMMLNLRAADADVYGKPPAFIYFESLDEVYSRRELQYQNCVLDVEVFSAAAEVRISGATLSGRTEVLRDIRYSTRNRGALDSAFHEAAAGRSLLICTFDGYGTVVFRSEDPLAHTWRINQDNLIRRCTRVGAGPAAIQSLL